MATISTYLDTRKKSVSGKYRVQIIVRSMNSAGFIPTEIVIEPKNWSNHKIVGTKQDKQLNRLLDMQVAALKLKLASYSATHNVRTMKGSELAAELSPETRKRKANIKDNNLIAVYWKSFVAKKKKVKTKETYIYTLNSIGHYCDAEKLRFSDITYTWLQSFDDWMEDRGNSVNTRSIHLRNLRAVYNEAIKEEIITQEGYPFRQFRIKTQQTAKRSLSIEELRLLRDYPCEEHIKKYVDVFFISFYLCGINMVDLLQLPKPIRNRIEYRRSKTGILCELTIPNEAQELINKYAGKELMLCFGEQYKNHKDFLHLMNENLQKVGVMRYVSVRTKYGAVHKEKKYTPIFPHLTSYWARHTWATIAAEIDIPDAVIDAALGHKSPYPMADIYIRRNAKKVDAAVRAVIDYVNSTDV